MMGGPDYSSLWELMVVIRNGWVLGPACPRLCAYNGRGCFEPRKECANAGAQRGVGDFEPLTACW